MSKALITKLQLLGISEKAAKMYFATLQLGGGTMQDLSRVSKVPRTSLYYTLQELLDTGALIESMLGKRKYYQAVPPKDLIKLGYERLEELTDALPELEIESGRSKTKAIQVLHGPQGFKLAWEKLLHNKEKEYRIITTGESFLDYVREKYIIRAIIGRKKMLKVKSYQLISETPYGQDVVKKDREENRESRFLPPGTKLPYSIAFSKNTVLLISSRSENVVLLWNSPELATTFRSLFEQIWDSKS